MAHNLVLSPVAPATVTVPDDGDDLNGASVETPFQQLGNFIHWNYLRATGAASFPGSISALGNVSCVVLNCNTVEALDDVIAQNEVYGQASVWTDGDLWAGGDVEATGKIIGGTAQIGGALTAGSVATPGNVAASGLLSGVGVSAGTSGVATTGSMYAGKGLKKRVFFGPNSDTTIVGADYDIVIAVITSTRTYTLSTSGAEDGMTICFHNDTPSAISLNIEAGSEDSVVATGEVAEYYFYSGIWRLLKKW